MIYKQRKITIMQSIYYIIVFAITKPEINNISSAAFGISLHFRLQLAIIVHIAPIYVSNQLIIYTVFSGITKFIVTVAPKDITTEMHGSGRKWGVLAEINIISRASSYVNNGDGIRIPHFVHLLEIIVWSF